MGLIQAGNEHDMIRLPQWHRSYFGNICAPEGSKELQDIVSAFIPQREASLVRIFEMKERIGPQGLDLLW